MVCSLECVCVCVKRPYSHFRAGCWDWWGYVGKTTESYAQRNGYQMKALFGIMQALGMK